MAFTLATWNILATSYIRPEFYPSTPRHVLDPACRVPEVVRQAIALDTDILCLQEVEVSAFAALQTGALYGLCPHQNNPLEGATLWDNLIDCPFHHFQYEIETGVNYFPRNVYPGDYPRLQDQLGPLRTYPVEVRDNEVWVDLG